MTPEQARIVQSTWPKVLHIEEAAARIFYRRLFEMDPSLKPMFLGDMREQGRKLMQVPGFAVNGLSQLESIVGAVRELGLRHAGYGVSDRHYDTVGAALQWTLARGLGAEFTPDVRDAWAAAYRVLASTMQGSAAARPVGERLSSRFQ